MTLLSLPRKENHDSMPSRKKPAEIVICVLEGRDVRYGRAQRRAVIRTERGRKTYMAVIEQDARSRKGPSQNVLKPIVAVSGTGRAEMYAKKSFIV
jgi:hypothetical protein